MNENVIQAILVFAAFVVVSLIIDRFLKQVAARFDSAASESFRLISNSQRVVLIFIGAVLALSKLGFDVGALVAGLGLTGFALGFALKDAISNLIAGIMIVLYKPIKLGNKIDITGSKGTVVDLNLRYITVKDEGVTHLVPNSLFLNNKVSIIDEDKQ
ncbi:MULTISPECIES: mechanosensitive ion channel family protein [Shewanella]|jgi:small-conductance mechanosensitive channel|uniref:Mechanosensitive ion channel family protein n=2 Tax=Unclassified Bacteria TaxID=49928 RepID=A0AAU6VWL0_UNCXX|nr:MULTISPECIES: mechanosensitive ion channel domain-containing protein [Shewanella]AYV13904.1 mechanosensitive ion channel protein MscS [Shewanella algae]EKT4487136.1 mechanosensitive ion channel [Shewanella algae]MBO2548006.1 mechanosensitive ion channel [Shewanella algae]MBO2552692.1 mechanosensitive ion channel [Shewanella algae]MBO2556930.1 mechanosensitive ion channel [Shewanella algae]